MPETEKPNEGPFDEDELLPISALQHFVFCPRRCALVHIERLWVPNVFTVEGEMLHERVDELGRESRVTVIVSHGVGIRSLQYGITGILDVVEFQSVSAESPGCPLADKQGNWLPYPIEYKRGTVTRGFGDDVQLCAQALCLEEMLGCAVANGAIFYKATKKRREIRFTHHLREQTVEAIAGTRKLLETGSTPPAEYGKKCETCSMIDLCQPKALGGSSTAGSYLAQYVKGL